MIVHSHHTPPPDPPYPDPDPVELGERVRLVREGHMGLTDDDKYRLREWKALCRRLEMTMEEWKGMERGEFKPSDYQIQELSWALQVNELWLRGDPDVGMREGW